MTITPGYYRTRGGNKARVLCTDAEGPHPIIGYICHKLPFALQSWAWDGVAGSVPGPLDLVHPWIEAPVVDWSKERDWVKAVAMDEVGVWYRYANHQMEGKHHIKGWYIGDFCQRLHPSEYPQFTGDWKDSLCIRPS